MSINSEHIAEIMAATAAFSSNFIDPKASMVSHLFLRAIATHGSTSLFSSLNLLKKPYNRR